jgi:hypothetical protein
VTGEARRANAKALLITGLDLNMYTNYITGTSQAVLLSSLSQSNLGNPTDSPHLSFCAHANRSMSKIPAAPHSSEL